MRTVFARGKRIVWNGQKMEQYVVIPIALLFRNMLKAGRIFQLCGADFLMQ
jgi:hypothetical protein